MQLMPLLRSTLAAQSASNYSRHFDTPEEEHRACWRCNVADFPPTIYRETTIDFQAEITERDDHHRFPTLSGREEMKQIEAAENKSSAQRALRVGDSGKTNRDNHTNNDLKEAETRFNAGKGMIC
ncbi:hypothetical protein HAX54_043319 [Datura stramonium]|uniref:Uncharacterized protein n=1 Tax=Datura stramonium TaxID=4076 RepID=A0ABS8W2M8_DATST|nr:hypothetical protein [Datura stramonium]